MDTDSKKLDSLPLVSITMPAYNCASYVREAIQSVLGQTYQNWELLITDDGSSDLTWQMITSLHDPRISAVRHEQNAGIVATRNELLERVNGEFIAVLDSDDMWLDTDKLRNQVAFLMEHTEYAVVGTYIRHLSASGFETNGTIYHTEDTAIRNHILLTNQFAHSSVLMRTNMLKKTAGYQTGLAEDLDLFLQLGKIGKFANIDEFMTGYRIHGRNISKKRREMAASLHTIIRRHSDSYPNAILALLKNFGRMLTAYLPK